MATTLSYTGKQTHGSNECGAYALTACLLALAKAPGQSTRLSYPVPGMGWSRTADVPASAVNSTSHADPCAQKIYAITGMFNISNNAYEQHLTSGLNPVSALAWVARTLGCAVSVWVNTTAFTQLQVVYPLEKCMTAKVLGAEPTISGTAPLLGSNEVRLVLVENGAHWIAQASNGYYDPASGLITATMPGSYTSTGCYITLS